jgi:hypothetical protein
MLSNNDSESIVPFKIEILEKKSYFEGDKKRSYNMV